MCLCGIDFGLFLGDQSWSIWSCVAFAAFAAFVAYVTPFDFLSFFYDLHHSMRKYILRASFLCPSIFPCYVAQAYCFPCNLRKRYSFWQRLAFECFMFMEVAAVPRKGCAWGERNGASGRKAGGCMYIFLRIGFLLSSLLVFLFLLHVLFVLREGRLHHAAISQCLRRAAGCFTVVGTALLLCAIEKMRESGGRGKTVKRRKQGRKTPKKDPEH